jgi:hypothetical protein
LLIKLRQESVKEDYDFVWECNRCSSSNKTNINICNLNMSCLEQNPSDVIELSDRDCKIKLGLSTRGDEKEILIYARKNSKDMKSGVISRAELVNCAYGACIREVIISDSEGNEKIFDNITFDDKMKMVDEMSYADKIQIKNFVEKLDDFGYDLDVEVTCKECKTTQVQSMEWLAFFIG